MIDLDRFPCGDRRYTLKAHNKIAWRRTSRTIFLAQPSRIHARHL